MRSAVGDEYRYVVLLPQLTALGFALQNVHANGADLGQNQRSAGMNVLSEFNFEIRPTERRILIEKIAR